MIGSGLDFLLIDLSCFLNSAIECEIFVDEL